jgi:hypothetical protein
VWRRTRQVARWRRPRLVAKGDPDHNAICARIRCRIARLPAGSVVLAEDEAHLDLLPQVRATWTLRGSRRQVMTPGKNRRATIFGALDVAAAQQVRAAQLGEEGEVLGRGEALEVRLGRGALLRPGQPVVLLHLALANAIVPAPTV